MEAGARTVYGLSNQPSSSANKFPPRRYAAWRGAKLLPKTTALLKYSLRRYANFSAQMAAADAVTHTQALVRTVDPLRRVNRAALLCFAF